MQWSNIWTQSCDISECSACTRSQMLKEKMMDPFFQRAENAGETGLSWLSQRFLGTWTGTTVSSATGTATGTSKTQEVLWAKQQLCTWITLFCTFLCRPCTTTTWNEQILSWLENGNGKAMNFTISLWIRTRSPTFSSKLTSLFSRNWVTWYKGQKVSEDETSIFQRRFHWHRRCWIVRSLLANFFPVPSNSSADVFAKVYSSSFLKWRIEL